MPHHYSLPPHRPTEEPEVLDRRTGPHGEVVLRRHGDLLQIIANGCFLMDTSDGRSERLLVDAAAAALDRDGGHLLIGGLGVGFSLAHAAADPRWGRITVVEREAAVIDWHRPGAPLSTLSRAALDDPRTEVLHTGLLEHLRTAGRSYDALCLDVDNGPDWTVTEDNEGLYTPTGLALCRERLAPGGVLAIWSAQPSAVFEGTLRNSGFQGVRTQEIPVARGVPDVVHLAVRTG
ncbi:spermidine synthase [Streptomyces sp. LE64]|uniref:spermidine synthase n=1 Tax=Streptomyces sp. LE64 TaxID=3448653 RepID=UPI0040426319